MNKARIILFLIGIIYGLIVSAQEDCSVTLKKARESYEKGVIERIYDILSPCMEAGFTKDEKIQAYKLIILSYLFDDKKEEAENAMYKFLKLAPEYELNTALDPAEFIKLFESYRTLPLYSVGLFAGTNFSYINSPEIYSLYSTGNNEGSYNSDLGFQTGIKFNRFLLKSFEVNADFMFCSRKYTYVGNYLSNTIEFKESQSWIGLPVTFTYDFMKGKIKPYARLGGSVDLLLNSLASVTRTYSDESKIADVTGPDIKLKTPNEATNLRKKWNYWAIVGAGVKYKVPTGNVFFDVRYAYGLRNHVQTENRYSNAELTHRYFYTDNNFFVDNLILSVGYTYSIYIPKKY